MKPFHYYVIAFALAMAFLMSIYIYHHGSDIHKLFAGMELYGAFCLIEAYYANKKGDIFTFKGSIATLGFYYAGRLSRKDNPKRVGRFIFIQTFLGMFIFVLGVGLHVILQ